MSEAYHIRIDSPRLAFSAAHFITYGGGVCEPLHGHNWHVAAEVHGQLDENQYVVDFVATRTALEEIVASLDHRMLLPTNHRTIVVMEQDGELGSAGSAPEVLVTHGDRRWIFPRQDCALLPVENTTAELLARYIAGQFREALGKIASQEFSLVKVAVDEYDGQWGVCEWREDR